MIIVNYADVGGCVKNIEELRGILTIETEEKMKDRYDPRKSPTGDFNEPRNGLHESIAHVYKSVAESHAIFSGKKLAGSYARLGGNPTVERLEAKLAELDGGAAALATNWGMGAIACVLFHFLKSGDEVVASAHLYGGTRQLLASLEKFGIKTHFIKSTDAGDLKKLLKRHPRAKMVFFEPISNPLGLMIHTHLWSLAARSVNPAILIVVDHTIPTPALLRPLILGADIVAYSLTKNVIGDSSVSGGAIVARNKALIDSIRANSYLLHGHAMPANSARKILKNISTLKERMFQHSDNAGYILKFLRVHPKVSEVHHPYPMGKEYLTPPPKIVWLAQLTPIISFKINAPREKVIMFIESLRHILYASHFGDKRTIITYPELTTHLNIGEKARREMGITPQLVRLSVGLEDPKMIIEDLEQAFAKI